MKKLVIMRHAKALSGDNYESDFDRELSEKGKQDAAAMGKRLQAKSFKPDFILCSAAKRTNKTAKIVATELGYAIENIEPDSELYAASAHDVLQILRQIADKHNNVILIGHNPTVTGLVGYLGNSCVDGLSTSGQACISFPISSWRLLMANSGKLEWVDSPKSN
ncbi:MAG: histidine phosphatase family protein [Bacteroidia bacterium]|nr:histidine phosphatase family protein [Bacteroidia bacterium]MCZ2141631.1 histidine phosphatase family protein [Bacteroidia bacterium]